MSRDPPTFAVQLSVVTDGLDLRRESDRGVCRTRIERAYDGLRFAEIHAEAERLTGRTFPLLRQARAAIVDAWMVDADNFQTWAGEPR